MTPRKPRVKTVATMFGEFESQGWNADSKAFYMEQFISHKRLVAEFRTFIISLLPKDQVCKKTPGLGLHEYYPDPINPRDHVKCHYCGKKAISY